VLNAAQSSPTVVVSLGDQVSDDFGPSPKPKLLSRDYRPPTQGQKAPLKKRLNRRIKPGALLKHHIPSKPTPGMSKPEALPKPNLVSHSGN